MKKAIASLILFLSACASPKLSVGVLDPTPRPASAHIEILRGNKPSHPYQEIATFSYPGQTKDEANAVAAMTEQARRLGADALILYRPESPFQGAFVPPIMWRAQGRRTFNGSALIYTDK